MESVYKLVDYLPIEDVEVSDYVRPLMNSAEVTYEKGEYQFSYFAVHLIFMTNIYTTVWQVSQFYNERYNHSLLFARPYNGKEVKLDEIKSVFEFSKLPEKDIFEFFRLIDLDNSYIKSTKKLIDYRNDMAHATGKIQIYSKQTFDSALDEIVGVTKKIHDCLSVSIRELYRDILIKYAKGSPQFTNDTPTDFIQIELVKNLSFSKKDLEVCKDFGLSKLKDWKVSGLSKDEIKKVVEFHTATTAYYNDLFGE
jgi:hypothetical protein